MGYLAAWKILEKMIMDFRKKGVAIPAEVMNDLKSARTTIEILDPDLGCGETAQNVDEYLRNVEVYVVSKGQEKFGAAYVEEWLKKMNEARLRTKDEEEETRFVAGVPRENSWVRVKPSPELPAEKLRKLAAEMTLSHKVQNDGALVVFGDNKRIKEFVKKMAIEYGLKPEK
jgi:hypothetical protein